MNYTGIKISIFFLITFCTGLYAESAPRGEFVVFPVYTGNPVHDAILSGTESALYGTCHEAGRLYPVGYAFRKSAVEKSEGKDPGSLYRKAAVHLKADVYALISSYSEKGDLCLKIQLIPLNDKYKNIEYEKIFISRIPDNLPLKAARDFAGILKNIPLCGTVLEILEDGSAVIDAGQWSGLYTGKYAAASGEVYVRNVSRFTSVVHGQDFKPGQVLEFPMYPVVEGYIKRLNGIIMENTVKAYGTDEKFVKRGGPVREGIHGTCIINQGASFCVPGYGSFLSTEYMGIEKAKPDYGTIFFTGALTAVHLGLVPVMTDFEVNFFPWVEDNDRTARMRRLNYFMWGTLPLTFTASFYSQLAYQYREKKLLPPAFADPDVSAAVVSVFIPGGGMFYKGYSISGWGIYLTELSLAGFAVYTEDKGERKALLCSLAVFKCLEIILSYTLPVSYPFYKKEIGSGNYDFSVSFSEDMDSGNAITASVSLHY